MNEKKNGSEIHPRIAEGIAIIHSPEGGFSIGGDLEKKHWFEDRFNELADSEEVKAVLIINDEKEYSGRNYRDFLQALKKLRKTNPQQAERLLSRLVHSFSHYSQFALNQKKLIVSGLTGDIVTPYFGLCLFSDFRLARQDIRFQLSHVELGVPPMGGLGFALPRFIGQGKAAEYLFTGGTIEAKEALDLGLVNTILPEKNFESNCISWIKDLLQLGTDHLESTRRLVNQRFDSVEEYFRAEIELRLKLWNHIDP